MTQYTLITNEIVNFTHLTKFVWMYSTYPLDISQMATIATLTSLRHLEVKFQNVDERFASLKNLEVCSV